MHTLSGGQAGNLATSGRLGWLLVCARMPQLMVCTNQLEHVIDQRLQL